MSDPPSSQAQNTENDLLKLQAMLKEDLPKRPAGTDPLQSHPNQASKKATAPLAAPSPQAVPLPPAPSSLAAPKTGGPDELLAGLDVPAPSYLDTTGFKRLQHMVLRIRNNIVYEQLASEKDQQQVGQPSPACRLHSTTQCVLYFLAAEPKAVQRNAKPPQRHAEGAAPQ